MLVSIIFLTNFFFISTYNFPYWGVSARIFFKLFWCTIFFSFCSPRAIFTPPPSPHHFSNGPPLTGHLGQGILFPAFPLEKMSHNTVQGVPKKYIPSIEITYCQNLNASALCWTKMRKILTGCIYYTNWLTKKLKYLSVKRTISALGI